MFLCVPPSSKTKALCEGERVGQGQSLGEWAQLQKPRTAREKGEM